MKYSWLLGFKKQSEIVYNMKESLKRKLDTQINDNSSVSTSTKKVKRYRSAFTTEQVNYLEMEFKKFAYIGSTRRKELSDYLNIPERAIKIWFQNRRMKEKKDANKGSDDEQKHLQTEKFNDGAIREQLINDTKQSTNHEEAISSVDRGKINLTNLSTDSILDMTKKLSNTHNTSIYSETLQELRIPEASGTSELNKNAYKENYSGSPKFSINAFKKHSKINDGIAEILKTEIDNNQLHKIPNLTDDSHFVTSSSQDLSYQSCVTPSLLPQDLTSKSNTQFLQTSTDNATAAYTSKSAAVVSGNCESSLYLNGLYAQTYFPPGNMMWKPINVAPIMSTGMPTVFGKNIGNISGLSGVPLITNNLFPSENLPQNTVMKNCNCDCHHEKASNPVIVRPANAIPQVQYVITALPFQTGNTKFNQTN